MNTTPLWVPLLVAVLGLLGTAAGAIGGVLITQRRSDEREAIAWEREQERERARWAREDAARTFEHRRKAYEDFYRAVTSYVFAPRNVYPVDGEDDPLEDVYTIIRIYGSPTAAHLAKQVHQSSQDIRRELESSRTDHARLNRAEHAWAAAIEQLLATIRAELGVPDAAESEPVP